MNASNEPNTGSDAKASISPISPDDRTDPAGETFRPTRRRRWRETVAGSFFIAANLLFAVLAVLLPWAHGGGGFTVLACGFVPVGVTFVFVVVNVNTAFTQVRPDGIRIRVGGRLHDLPWNEVQSITVESHRRRGTLFNVILITTTGKRLVLGTPTCHISGDRWLPSSEFSEQYDRIAARWKAATAADTPSAAALDDIDEV